MCLKCEDTSLRFGLSNLTLFIAANFTDGLGGESKRRAKADKWEQQVLGTCYFTLSLGPGRCSELQEPELGTRITPSPTIMNSSPIKVVINNNFTFGLYSLLLHICVSLVYLLIEGNHLVNTGV